MLVLTRKIGESIHIGDDICLTILSVQGQNVKVGILAPKDVVVHRQEIYERIVEENRRAALKLSPENIEQLLRFGGLLNDNR